MDGEKMSEAVAGGLWTNDLDVQNPAPVPARQQVMLDQLQ